MRVGQRGRFIGHENYDGYLEGGELFTVVQIDDYFPGEDNWLFKGKLDTGETTGWLLSDQVEWLTEEDDLKILKVLIDKYPEQAKKLIEEIKI